MMAQGILKSQFGRGLDVALAFLTTVVLTRLLGVDWYGKYVLIFGWLSFAGLLISLGLQEAISRHLPRITAAKYAPNSLLITSLIIRITLASILALLVWFNRAAIFSQLGHPELSEFTVWMILLFILMQSSLLCWTYFVAQLKLDITIISNLIRNLTILVGSIWLWNRQILGFELILQLVCVGYSLNLVIYLIATWRTRSQELQNWPWRRVSTILRFGISAWGVAFVSFLLAEQTDILLLGYLVEDSRSIAYYQVGTALVWKLIGVITVSSHLVLATLTMSLEKGGKDGLMRSWQLFIKLSTITIVPSYVFLAWYAPQIIELIYGAEYSPSGTYLRLFLLLMLFPVGLLGGGLHLMTLYAWDKERRGLLLRIVAGTFNLGAAIVLINRLGPIGVVWATGLATLLGTILEYLAVQKEQRIPYPWRYGAKIIASVLLSMFAVSWSVGQTWISLGTTGIAYGLILLLCLRFLRPLSSSDRQTLENLAPGLNRYVTWFTVSQ